MSADLPLGGSTGLSHEHSAVIEEAARWIIQQRPTPSPIVPALRRQFDLTPAEACQAIREANLIKGRAT